MDSINRTDFELKFSDTAQRVRVTPLIFVISQDAILIARLRELFLQEGLNARVFPNANTRIAPIDPYRVDGIVLDLDIPGRDGFDIQQDLTERGINVPVIVMGSGVDVPTSIRVMKRGAIDLLIKPLNEAHLKTALREAIAISAAQRHDRNVRAVVTAHAAALSPREHEVMRAVVKGMLNKQIAFALGIAEITVKLHRRMVMRKMQASSLADLVRKAELIAVPAYAAARSVTGTDL